MRKAGLKDLELTQQRVAAEVLATDGPAAFARYVAAEHTMNVHFAYERAQRSVVEMGQTGRILGSLLAFPRSWAERFVREARKFVAGGTYTRRRAALNRILQMSIMAIVAGEIYRLVSGRKRNPYNPLNILHWTPGGLVVGAAQEFSESVYLVTAALCGDQKAEYQLTQKLPRLAELFLPGYATIRDSVDALTGTEGCDRLALRPIRTMFRKKYRPSKKSYQVQRDFRQAVQKTVFGAKTKKKPKPKARKARRQRR